MFFSQLSLILYHFYNKHYFVLFSCAFSEMAERAIKLIRSCFFIYYIAVYYSFAVFSCFSERFYNIMNNIQIIYEIRFVTLHQNLKRGSHKTLYIISKNKPNNEKETIATFLRLLVCCDNECCRKDKTQFQWRMAAQGGRHSGSGSSQLP